MPPPIPALLWIVSVSCCKGGSDFVAFQKTKGVTEKFFGGRYTKAYVSARDYSSVAEVHIWSATADATADLNQAALGLNDPKSSAAAL